MGRNNRQELKQAIDHFIIREGIEKNVFPGACYALVTTDGTIMSSLGLKARFPAEEANSIDTLYDLASVTKVVGTTSAFLKLLEQGKIRLDDFIVNLLPELTSDTVKEVRVWNLLTHTSGLRPFIPSNEYKTRAELIEKIYATPLVAEPGKTIVYSDLNYILLAWIIEKISGESLDSFLKRELWEPLDMVDTTFNPADAVRCAPTEDRGDYIDRGYVHDERAHDLGGVAGHAGLFSTVKDLSHFIEMVLNDGVFRGKRIFSSAIIDLMFTPQAVVTNGVEQNATIRSVGWIMKGDWPCAGDLVSPATIMHTGFTGTCIWIDRKNRVGFTLLTNRVHPTRNNVKILRFRPLVGNFIIGKLGYQND